MLKLPAHRHYPGATVFQDDAMFWKFYVVPSAPQVRVTADGKPAIKMIKYRFGDEDREENPDLPRGGGYLAFDSELRVDDKLMEDILEDLEKDVQYEWQQLQNAPDGLPKSLTLSAIANDEIGDHWNRPGHEGTPRASGTRSSGVTLELPDRDAPIPMTEQPPVIISEPLWISGKVRMLAPQSEHLVTSRVGEAPAAMVGTNVATFNMDLTSAGATFMQQTLLGSDGRGSDWSAIAVVYELTMLAKLPPATVFIRFDTAQVYHAMQELFHEHDNCSDDYFTSENLMTQAMSVGLVEVKIDAGGITDEDLLQSLMSQAKESAQQLLVDKFGTKERAPLEEWGDDVAGSSGEHYRLKQVTEIEHVTYQEMTTITPTIEHTIAPQGTLQTFLRGADVRDHVHEIDLDDEFFTTLNLTARAYAKWAEDDIAFADIDILYKHRGETKPYTFHFTPESTDAQVWRPFVIDGRRDYKWRWRVAFNGREAGEWSDWEKSTSRNLNVAIETPGKLDVEVTGVGLDFENELDAVLVRLKYGDRRNDVADAEHSVLLTADRLSGRWQRLLYAPWERPVEYRVQYLLTTGEILDDGWKKTEGPTNTLVIPRPGVDRLDVVLLPAGHWDEVIHTAVDLEYVEGDYHRDVQMLFSAQDQFRRWAVILRDPEARTFRYKILTTFKNGDIERTDWISVEGDQSLPVLVKGPPRLRVIISGNVIDYTATPLVTVTMQYEHPVDGLVTDSFSLDEDARSHTWDIPVPEAAARSYRHRVTYYPVDGEAVEEAWVESTDELLVVDTYRIPRIGAEIHAMLVDFEATPAIEVNLAYDDPERGVSERETLVFSEKGKQSWFVVVDEDAPRSYRASITWHLADGAAVTSRELTLDKRRFVLPRTPSAD